MEQIIILALFLFSVILHECAHGLTAFHFGDDTAKKAGRITMNPLKHIDPIFTIVLPVLLLLTAGIALGGPRPVPINKSKLRDPDRSMVWVALSGPSTNLALSFFFLALSGFFLRYNESSSLPERFNIHLNGISILYNIGLMNFLLTFFNLLPVPPLDGSRILYYFVPDSARQTMNQIEKFGIIILIFLLLSGIIGYIIDLLISGYTLLAKTVLPFFIL